MASIVFGMRFNQAKSNFFFSKSGKLNPILNAMDKVTVKVLSRFGAYTMTTARGLIRSPGKKGAASKPGKPPKNRTGLLRDFIFFSYAQFQRSVVIGPTKLNQNTGAPHTLEYGGAITVRVGKHKYRRVFIQPRPYMQPALEKNKTKLPALWRAARAAN